MSDSTRRPADGKMARPAKPSPDFPLYAHKVGRWAKKVRGSTVYFTHWADDPRGEEALRQWEEQKEDLLAGRDPDAQTGGLTVLRLVNEFLAYKESQVDEGDLRRRTFLDYRRTCGAVRRRGSRFTSATLPAARSLGTWASSGRLSSSSPSTTPQR